MINRVEAEMRMRQQALLQEIQREQAAERASLKARRVTGPPRIHTQFFAQRFGAIASRPKMQPA